MWESWSSCNQLTGKKQRTRQCNNPASPYEIASCSGPSTDKTECKGKYHLINKWYMFQ